MNSSAKIKDLEHATRVLESLVEQTEGQSSHKLHYLQRWDGTHLELALVEGAKAVLDEYKKVYILVFDKATADDMAHINQADQEAKEKMLVALAQAYAPRMAEAGMEVPE